MLLTLLMLNVSGSIASVMNFFFDSDTIMAKFFALHLIASLTPLIWIQRSEELSAIAKKLLKMKL